MAARGEAPTPGGLSEAALERELAELGRHLAYPPTPDLAAAVRRRLAAAPPPPQRPF